MWSRSGNFQAVRMMPGEYPIRHVVYTSFNSVISELDLLACSDGAYEIRMKAPTPEKYAQLIQVITVAGFPQPDSSDRDMNVYEFRFAVAHRNRFNQLLSAVGTICDLREIADDIHAKLDFAMRPYSRRRNEGLTVVEVLTNSNPLEPVYPGFFSISGPEFSPSGGSSQHNDFPNAVTASMQVAAASSTSLPDIGANAKKLAELNYQEEISEEYECKLTNHVMTDPVFDPSHPDIKFERAAIERALERKKENPYTRAPLTKDKLVSDVVLKERIDAFISDVVASAERKLSPRK